jgi:hypothetical protein
LIAFSVLLFYKTSLHSGGRSGRRGVPLVAVWLVIASLIWLAENIATYANIWLYPNQLESWQMVSLGKLSSWYLLMLLSFVLISLIKFTQNSTVAENYLKFASVTYVVLIPLIIINANLGYSNDLFGFVKDVPGRHHTAHIIIFGALAVIANMMNGFKTVKIRGVRVLSASVAVFLLVTMEELSQIWIGTRVFDWMDILSSLVGIVVMSLLALLVRNRLVLARR